MKGPAKSTDQLLAERRQLRADLAELPGSPGAAPDREARLQEALTFAESIVETVREPLVVLDGQLRVVLANPAFYRTFQVTPEDTEGHFIYDLGNRQWDNKDLRKLLEDIIPKQNSFENFEVEHDFPKIGRKTMLLNARLIPGRGTQPDLILLAIEDITEQKKTREALQKAYEDLEKRVTERTRELALANKRLEQEIEERKRTEERLAQKALELARSNADLEQFAYIVSHDLREPLHVAAGFLQLLSRRYRKKLDAKGQEFIACALDSLQRLEQQIQDLLDYSRITTRGKEFTPVDLNQVVTQVLKDMSLIVEEKKARITRESLPTVMGDASQLARVYQNLIGNALKFCGDKPPRVHLGVREEGDEWHLFVQDQGIGIDPRHYDRIFRMFERLHPRSRYPGTGIGLAICRKIVERHGGRIWVESEPGQGSTFWFALPKTDSSSSTRTSHQGP